MAESFKYGLIGSSGRLGEEVKSVFNENKTELVYSYSLEGEVKKGIPDVLIDCSLPDVFDRSITYVKEYKIPLVMATTGLSDIQINILKDISNSIPVVQSYNYSVGIQILLKLLSIAKEKLPGWDVEIEETHHRFKKDKPSGTAKMIQKLFEGKEINTSSLRLGNIPGDHIVHFGGLGEVLSIKHSATSRRTFAEGIFKAAEFILTKKNGFYTFTDVIF
jgi:4-hydroxy-tetrahydrodipicolinate reductase